ncbi:GNAT family N-acetyltransferase [Labrenzia sp. 011]|uniref:GNAT family N-acetyltransferase n=1 Tax=Labrenzia sp. 011 TaxID=2171494 RepID=UPI000D5175CD|nr:GNAT family N-acetyltransferase [Labrenzia sp. 011]PVB59532.1 GNAT family N-acetyltransferase [Labrenzia sp. 011]
MSDISRHLKFEPFDPDRHDRTAFSCGVDQVDNYFKKTANKLQKAGNVRVSVLLDADEQLLGFYAVNAHSVDYAELPKKYARTRPSHGSIPAAFISMIGVDQRFQGKGLGGVILVEALKKLAKASEEVGIAVVLLDVMDCGNEEATKRRLAIYSGYGFWPLQGSPLRLFMPIQDARAMLD